MLKAILFDLDGTLLPLETNVFINKYIELVSTYFSQIIEPQDFITKLLSSTEEMVKNNNTNSTNQEVFMKSFLPSIAQDEKTILLLFEKFYTEEFTKLKKYIGYSPLAGQVVERAYKKGYDITLATNPLFPKLAVEHRMEWAGVKKFPWQLITTYENSSSCKPNKQYFTHICEKIELLPEECLMVGNDVQEDIIAGSVGMKTFLVTDYLIDRGKPYYKPDYQGTLQELHQFLSDLPDKYR